MLRGVPFGDSHFRHSLRNHLNSLNLGIAVCDVSTPEEYPEWMVMIEQTASDCVTLLDDNPPGIDDGADASTPAGV